MDETTVILTDEITEVSIDLNGETTTAQINEDVTAVTLEGGVNIYTITNNIYEEQLTGIDNVTTIFTTTYNYLENTTQLYYNGVKLLRGTDYNESIPNTISLQFTPKTTGFADTLIIQYIKA